MSRAAELSRAIGWAGFGRPAAGMVTLTCDDRETASWCTSSGWVRRVHIGIGSINWAGVTYPGSWERVR